MNVAHQHHLVISGYLLKSLPQQLIRVLGISGEPFFISADHPGGRGDQSLARGIVARPPNKSAYGLLDLLAGGAGDASSPFCRRFGAETVFVDLGKLIHTVFSETRSVYWMAPEPKGSRRPRGRGMQRRLS
jgi:hypothetical protein